MNPDSEKSDDDLFREKVRAEIMRNLEELENAGRDDQNSRRIQMVSLCCERRPDTGRHRVVETDTMTAMHLSAAVSGPFRAGGPPPACRRQAGMTT